MYIERQENIEKMGEKEDNCVGHLMCSWSPVWRNSWVKSGGSNFTTFLRGHYFMDIVCVHGYRA